MKYIKVDDSNREEIAYKIARSVVKSASHRDRLMLICGELYNIEFEEEGGISPEVELMLKEIEQTYTTDEIEVACIELMHPVRAMGYSDHQLESMATLEAYGEDE